MKVYKTNEDTLCIQGKRNKEFEIENPIHKGKELVDSVFNGLYYDIRLDFQEWKRNKCFMEVNLQATLLCSKICYYYN